MKKRLAGLIFVLVILAGTVPSVLAQGSGGASRQEQASSTTRNPPPRSASSNPDESSSRDTKVDLGPPPGEEGHAPGADAADVQEMHPYDPHKAQKNIEVGDYYLRQKNYRAAASRYREALYWKDNDALAQFRLGQALEGMGQYASARQYYEAYLKTLPQGPLAGDARKASDRLRNRSDDPVKSAGPAL